MNKQEAINELKKYKVGFGEVAAVRFDRIVSVINQIHEPQKVVVPKVVAEWIDKCNDRGYSLRDSLKHISLPPEINSWLLEDEGLGVYSNQDKFARAWLDGYEIEQEKLYTVAIPNPNSIGAEVHILMMNGFKQVVIKKELGNDWKKKKAFQLTEEEIKQDFEWAWQFAKEVE
ncbi:DUF1642 domain-containing protein [Streptococcus suis]|nr:DUF1642 domain-containing protein [Streptococcus suis]